MGLLVSSAFFSPASILYLIDWHENPGRTGVLEFRLLDRCFKKTLPIISCKLHRSRVYLNNVVHFYREISYARKGVFYLQALCNFPRETKITLFLMLIRMFRVRFHTIEDSARIRWHAMYSYTTFVVCVYVNDDSFTHCHPVICLESPCEKWTQNIQIYSTHLLRFLFSIPIFPWTAKF